MSLKLKSYPSQYRKEDYRKDYKFDSESYEIWETHSKQKQNDRQIWLETQKKLSRT